MSDSAPAAQAAPTLSVCVVNWNGAKILGETLSAVAKQGDLVGEILLIDNASQDDSIRIVERSFPDVRVFRLEENLGPGAARNAGFRAARHDRILFVDNDVALDAGCARALAAALDANPSAVAAMPCVVSAERPGEVDFVGADAHFLGGMSIRRSAERLPAEPGDAVTIGSIVTSCFLMDRGVWGTDEPFDASFFFNYEDHDFGLRARARGHQLLSVPQACCRHGAGTPGLSFRAGGAYSSGRVTYLIRNRWQILAKSYALRTLLVLAPMLAIYELAQLAGVVAKGWHREWAEAVRWMVGHVGDVRGKRRSCQALRAVSDRELLSGGPIPIREEFKTSGLQRIGMRALDALAEAYWSPARRFL